MNKDVMSERLREFLGLDIKFEKLPKDDLKKLYDFFNDPENIIRVLIDRLGIEKFIETSNTVIKKKIIESRPLKTLLKKLIFENLMRE